MLLLTYEGHAFRSRGLRYKMALDENGGYLSHKWCCKEGGMDQQWGSESPSLWYAYFVDLEFQIYNADTAIYSRFRLLPGDELGWKSSL